MGTHVYRLLGIIALGLWSGAGNAHGAVVIFKDGFFITGKVKQPRDFITDPASGASFTIPLPGGYYYVDDVVRRILFSPSQVQEVLDEDPGRDKDLIKLKKFGTNLVGDAILPGWKIQSVSNWDEHWERYIQVDAGGKTFEIRQRLTVLTPKMIRVDTLRFNWIPFYFANDLDFGPKTVRDLLFKYYQTKKEKKESDWRLQIFRFLYQAGWYDQAARELDQFRRQFPALKSEIEPYQENLKKVRAAIFVDTVLQAHKVGQHQEVEKALKQYDLFAAHIGEKQQLQVQEVKLKLEEGAEKLKKARHFLEILPKRTQNKALFTKAAADIAGELSLETLPRLEDFVVFAEQLERQQKQRKKPNQSADQVLALALTGWTQGGAVAEPDPKAAESLWLARKMILEYQKTEDQLTRKQMLDSFLKKHPLAIDVLGRVIRHLPPVEPFPQDKVTTDIIKLDIAVEGPAQGYEYYLQLPPEYCPHRPYPVLIMLNASGDKAKHMLERLSEQGARHGYILVAPVWYKGLRGAYQHSPKEHAVVLDCLRDLRRRFQVDCDRVFLFGFREGGTMAFDVGLSHPDQFAGVLTMSGTPVPFPRRYWSNGQYLPFYAVEGDFNGNNPKYHRLLFKDWIRGQYPSLYVEYKGRGSEWFEAELPTMFDWMNRKKRLHPLRQLGILHTGGRAGEEFKTLRPCDNHFYWLSTEAIAANHLAGAGQLNRNIMPATLQARIAVGNEAVNKGGVAVKAKIWNQINVQAHGVRQLSIWLGPKMIDFDKPVVLRVNSNQVGPGRMVPPNPFIMLEDFYARGDRLQLFYARWDLRF